MNRDEQATVLMAIALAGGMVFLGTALVWKMLFEDWTMFAYLGIFLGSKWLLWKAIG